MLNVLDKIREYINRKHFDHERLEAAFKFAANVYAETDVDVNFGLKVVDKLIEFKPDEDALIAIVLYDLYVLDFLNEEKIKDEFGLDVFEILQNLRRLSSLHYAEYSKTSQAEVLRKMFITMAKDIRVVVIWLTIRVCQLEDLEEDPKDLSHMRLARETMHIYVPIASRLGIYRLKTQLEDLAFEHLNPEAFNGIKDQVERFLKEREIAISMMVEAVDKFLHDRSIKAMVKGRRKSVYSIYRKLKRKNLAHVSELFDFFAIRVILKPAKEATESDVDALYGVLGLLHSEWRPISSRFKDYVAVPKPNGYRSLHTVLLGLAPKDADQPVEIQIRDLFMHREAEYGIASHWLYKDFGSSNVSRLSSQVDWIRGLEQMDDLIVDEDDTLNSVEIDVFKDRIFVLTPRGDVKDLPAGSIAVDFAYAVHTDVGHACVMAKVNGSVVPLDYELKNGDVVEIVTKKGSEPKLEWLSKVRSNFARGRIKAWFSSINRDKNIKEGKRLLNSQLERLGKPLLDHNYSILKKLDGQTLTVAERETVLEEIGKGDKVANTLVRKLYPYEKTLVAVPRTNNSENFSVLSEEDMAKKVLVAGQDGMSVKFSQCCRPALGVPIVAYVTRGNRVSIHRANCRLLDSLDPDRLLIAKWDSDEEEEKPRPYELGLRVRSISRIGLLRDMSTVFSDRAVDILDIRIERKAGGLVEQYFQVQFENLNIFDSLVDALEAIDGVLKVTKVD